MKLGALANDVAIDLGTENIRIYYKGTTINEPAVIAYDEYNDKIVAVGLEAYEMIDRNPETITVIKPLSGGVITDFEMACQMINAFLGKVIGGVIKPRVIISVPSGITDVERRAARDAIMSFEMREVYLIESPIAGAIGASCDVTLARGMMLVDFGGGKCNIAAISLGQTVNGRIVRLGGNDFTEALISYIEEKHDLKIGWHTAERVKKEIGCAFQRDNDETMVISGYNKKNRKPEKIVVHSEETREAFTHLITKISASIKSALDETPTELLGDIMEDGILLVGGGALLYGMAKKLRIDLGVKVFLADDAELCVSKGTAAVSDNLDKMNESNSYVFTKC